MTKENQEILFRRYPILFKQKDLPLTETAMCWGIECGDGWFTILDELCELLTLYEENVLDSPQFHLEHLELTQVKEKYGSLRVYINFEDDYIFKLIDQAEAQSRTTCEICGRKGRIWKIRRWYMALCFWHYLKRRLKRR